MFQNTSRLIPKFGLQYIWEDFSLKTNFLLFVSIIWCLRTYHKIVRSREIWYLSDLLESWKSSPNFFNKSYQFQFVFSFRLLPNLNQACFQLTAYFTNSIFTLPFPMVSFIYKSNNTFFIIFTQHLWYFYALWNSKKKENNVLFQYTKKANTLGCTSLSLVILIWLPLPPVPYTTVRRLSTSKNANMSLFLFVFRLLLLLFVVLWWRDRVLDQRSLEKNYFSSMWWKNQYNTSNKEFILNL